jgi:aldehyde:ferredoxin oxidoreductase
MDQILRIQMGGATGPSAKAEPVGAYAGLGGRALTSTLVAGEVPPTCHPLGAENKLVIAPGLLSGSAAAMSGRISVGCKSPLTGGIKEANSGGQAAQVLARLGYAAIVLEGKPADNTLYRVFVNKDGVKIEPDDSLRMLGNYDTVEKMKARYGDKIATISIGQAGEMKLSGASVAFSDMELRPTRHAGRGGVGAVMGAKGVKVIVLDDAGMPMRSPADPEKFKAANKAFVAGLRQHPVTGEGLPKYGTDVLINVLNEAGALPTHNFTWGRFDGAAKVSGETMAETEIARGGKATHGCHRGCVARAPMWTKTGSSSPSSPSTRPSGPTAPTAASTTWTPSQPWTAWTTTSAWTRLKWAPPSRWPWRPGWPSSATPRRPSRWSRRSARELPWGASWAPARRSPGASSGSSACPWSRARPCRPTTPAGCRARG